MKHLRNVSDLNIKSPKLAQVLENMQDTQRGIFKNQAGQELAILETIYKLSDKSYRLFAFQDIKAELQAKELEAWQNLTKVLRHEIMNSIAPISSLTSTLTQVLEEDVQKEGEHHTIPNEGLEDLQEGLGTISGRSQGLIDFVNAYRDYTNLPTPSMQKSSLNELLRNTIGLVKAEFEASKVELILNNKKEEVVHEFDEQLIQMVLINLLKNAREAVENNKSGKVTRILRGQGKWNLHTCERQRPRYY